MPTESLADFYSRLQAGDYASFTTDSGERFEVITPGLPEEHSTHAGESMWTCVASADATKARRHFTLRGGKWCPAVASAAAADARSGGPFAVPARPPQPTVTAPAAAAASSAPAPAGTKPARTRGGVPSNITRTKTSMYYNASIKLSHIMTDAKPKSLSRCKVRVQVRSVLFSMLHLLRSTVDRKEESASKALVFSEEMERLFLEDYNMRSLNPSFLLGMMTGAGLMVPHQHVDAMSALPHRAYAEGELLDERERRLCKELLGHLSQARIAGSSAASAAAAAGAASGDPP